MPDDMESRIAESIAWMEERAEGRFLTSPNATMNYLATAGFFEADYDTYVPTQLAHELIANHYSDEFEAFKADPKSVVKFLQINPEPTEDDLYERRLGAALGLYDPSIGIFDAFWNEDKLKKIKDQDPALDQLGILMTVAFCMKQHCIDQRFLSREFRSDEISENTSYWVWQSSPVEF